MLAGVLTALRNNYKNNIFLYEYKNHIFIIIRGIKKISVQISCNNISTDLSLLSKKQTPCMFRFLALLAYLNCPDMQMTPFLLPASTFAYWSMIG